VNAGRTDHNPFRQGPFPRPMRPRVTRSEVRRAVYAIAAVLAAEVVGTIGFRVIEGVAWINAFYFESMLATGQGPPFTLNTDAGKIFASIMGFVSVGSVLSAVIFVVGPIAIRLWHEGMQAAEAEARRIEQAVARGAHRIEEELGGRGPADDRRPPTPPS
jgi:hypothetical protein